MAGTKGSNQGRNPALPELFGRALLDMATQVFGGRMERSAWPPDDQDAGTQRPPEPSRQADLENPADEAAEVLEKALSHTEELLTRMEERASTPSAGPALQEIADLQRSARGILQDLKESALLLQAERGRLNEEISRLTAIADRLERAAAPAAAPREEPASSSSEPAFAPSNGALELIVGDVPGFQGLMDTQRGLTVLPGVTSASVQSYRNGEASLEVVLRDALTATQVVETLNDATGHGLLIEEVRPDAHRLRLRFVDGA